ncbi:MAG TPA: OmpA family protein [Vicinamibacterales bacterium]|nr:OmpA family protein [Vicinamibacterales bacterium]
MSLATAGAVQAQDSRPSGNTVVGDTGLWFVPTGETLPKGRWSGGVQRVNSDRSEGFSDVSDIGGMFAFGVTERVELFGSLGMRRIDADLVPVALNGQPQDYLINKGWSTGFSDVTVGAKFGLLSQDNGYNVALRAMAKLPTASRDDGLGTGKTDFQVDVIASREFAEKVELSLSIGGRFRGSPDGYNLSQGLRWGIGGAFPSRSRLRVIGEMYGEALADQDQEFTGTNPAPGMPSAWDPDATRDLFGGFQYNFTNGLYIGAGMSYTASYYRHRRDFTTSEDSDLDRLGLQVRIGFYPGAAPEAAPVQPTAPPTPGPPPNRAPTVKARCEPCTVEVGRQLTASADAQDPDGDTLRYRWTSPTGAFGNANDRQTPWTAPMQPGAVPLTVTVDDGKGMTATDTVTVQVIAPAAKKQITFEDVHFDFDRYSLRPEAARILDEAIKALQEDANLRITVEGHTCNIGTNEYNLALGERRSAAVRDYLQSRGINASRLQTVSYGEERPRHDNSREETRRLNRRAAMTIRVQ